MPRIDTNCSSHFVSPESRPPRLLLLAGAIPNTLRGFIDLHDAVIGATRAEGRGTELSLRDRSAQVTSGSKSIDLRLCVALGLRYSYCFSLHWIGEREVEVLSGIAVPN